MKNLAGIIIVWLVAFIAILAVGAVGIALFAGVSTTNADNGIPKKLYNCEVSIGNDWTGKAYISTASCNKIEDSCSGLVNFWSKFNFGIIQSEGTVSMYDSYSKLDGKSYKVGIIEGQTVTLTGCSSDSIFTIKLYNGEGNLLQTVTSG